MGYTLKVVADYERPLTADAQIVNLFGFVADAAVGTFEVADVVHI